MTRRRGCETVALAVRNRREHHFNRFFEHDARRNDDDDAVAQERGVQRRERVVSASVRACRGTVRRDPGSTSERASSPRIWTPFGSLSERRERRREPAVDADGNRSRRAQRCDQRPVDPGGSVGGETERPLRNRRDAREPPLLEPGGRESRAARIARSRSRAPVQPSAAATAPVRRRGGIRQCNVPPAGWPASRVRRLGTFAFALRATSIGARLRSSRSLFLRGEAPAPCRRSERCDRPAARARNPARCSSAGAGSG